MKTQTAQLVWSASEQSLWEQIADQIIPASADGKIPAPSACGVGDYLASIAAAEAVFRTGLQREREWLVQQCRDRADHQAGLREEDWATLTSELEMRSPAFFSRLCRHIYMGYYSQAKIRPLFGLSADPPQPNGYRVSADDPEELAALLKPVVERGDCFRKC